ncbi:MAG: hypothetical protein AAGD06_30355 [Acidobacteriota bacterium]
MRALVSSFALLFLLVPSPARLSAAETEVTPPVRITPPGSTFYNTTGIVIGDHLWVYHQGDDGVEGGGDPNCLGSQGDRIIAYRAPLDNGVPGAFERVGRISPAAKSPVRNDDFWPPSCVHPPAAFGPGAVFKSTTDGVTTYHLLADVSDTFIFQNVWRAESTDGLNWTWYVSGTGNANGTETLVRSDTAGTYTLTSESSAEPFLEITVAGYSLLNPVMERRWPGVLPPVEEKPVGQARVLAGGNQVPTTDGWWWGYLNFLQHGGDFGVTGLEVQWTASGPTIRYLEDHASGPRWRTAVGGKIDTAPAALIQGATVKSLVFEDLQYQVWGGIRAGTYGQNVGCDTDTEIQCQTPGGCPTGDGSHVAQGEFAKPFWLNTGPQGPGQTGSAIHTSGVAWWPASPGAVGPRNLVFSLVRPLPSGYGAARLFPFRWNAPGGGRYLFTATNDDNICDRFLFSPFLDMYTVGTTLED